MVKLAACQVPSIAGEVSGALSTIIEYAQRAESTGAQLVCFPEAYLQGYEVSQDHVRGLAMEIQSTEFERVLRQLRHLNITLVLGIIERDGPSFFNSVVVVEAGSVICRYRKLHLLPSERGIFEPGEAPAVFALSDEVIGINICSDLNHAECVQATADAGATIIICPCNNMMSPAKAEHWKARHNKIRAERARESDVWLLSSDVTGRSGHRISYGPTAVIEPGGRIVDQVPIMTTGIIVVDTYALSAA